MSTPYPVSNLVVKEFLADISSSQQHTQFVMEGDITVGGLTTTIPIYFHNETDTAVASTLRVSGTGAEKATLVAFPDMLSLMILAKRQPPRIPSLVLSSNSPIVLPATPTEFSVEWTAEFT